MQVWIKPSAPRHKDWKKQSKTQPERLLQSIAGCTMFSAISSTVQYCRCKGQYNFHHLLNKTENFMKIGNMLPFEHGGNKSLLSTQFSPCEQETYIMRRLSSPSLASPPVGWKSLCCVEASW
jgi:hypothetical protein